MAEYYALLNRAVGALPRNDEASRREIYVKARSALIKQLKAIDPPLPAAEISKQRLALEDAIRRVEREAVEAAAAAALSEEEISRRAEQALAEALGAGPDVARAAATQERATQPQPEPPAEAEPEPQSYRQPLEPEPPAEVEEEEPLPGHGEEQSQRDEDAAYAEVVTPPVRPRAAPRAAPAQTPFERAPNVTDVDTTPPPPRGQPRDAASRARSGGRGWERPPRRQRRTTGGRITIAVLLVLILAAGAYFAATEWEQVEDFIDSVLGNDDEGGDEAALAADADADGAGDGEAGEDGDPADVAGAGDEAGDPAGAPVEEPELFLEPEAVFYIESGDPDVPAERYEATIEWRLLDDPETGAVIAADITVPERELDIDLRIARSPDPDFSHDVIVQATLENNADSGPLQQVENLAVKSTEEGIGVALEGEPDARQNLFYIPLPVDSERQNTTRLRISPWFDLSLVYQSGERAIVSFSKGTDGDEIFAQALDAWAEEAGG